MLQSIMRTTAETQEKTTGLCEGLPVAGVATLGRHNCVAFILPETWHMTWPLAYQPLTGRIDMQKKSLIHGV